MNRRTALRWTGYVAVAIAFAIACAFLSNWQFTRNAERERQLGLIAANYDAAPVATPNPLESPSDDPGPHLSYAIQWILFAVMGFVFIWYMIRTEIRHRREDAQDAAAADAAAPASPGIAVADAGAAAVPAASPRPRRRREGRKRDRDMVDEDALLDELTPR